MISIDTETTGLNPFKGDLPFAVCFYREDDTYDYFEGKVDPYTRAVTFSPEDLAAMRKLATSGEDVWMHNAKFDRRMLENIGVHISGNIFDTYLAAKACCSAELTYELKALSKKYLGIDNDDETDLKKQTIAANREAKKRGWNTGDEYKANYWLPAALGYENLCKIYCVRDCERTIKLAKFYIAAMKAFGVSHVFKKDTELQKCIYDISSRGVRVNLDWTADELADAFILCESQKKKIKAIANEYGIPNFNIDSPTQLADLLFQKIGLKPTKLTPAGKPSCDNTVLEKLIGQHPVLDEIAIYKQHNMGVKLLKNYIEFAVPDHIKTIDDWQEWKVFCVHTNYDEWGATTNRLSAREPALQTIPDPEKSKTTELANEVNCRRSFIPRKGYTWFSYDYKSLELVIFADRANEEKMLAAIASGRDIHNEIGQVLFKTENVLEWQRKLAKNTGYTKIYAGGVGVLTTKYGFSPEIAKLAWAAYDNEFPTIKTYSRELSKKAERDGYIINAYNRKIWVDGNASYKAINYDIQSSAADLMKRAIINCHRFLQQSKLDAHIVQTVHDELIFEINNKDISNDLLCTLRDLMEDHGGAFNIPIKTDCKMIKTSWANPIAMELAE